MKKPFHHKDKLPEIVRRIADSCLEQTTISNVGRPPLPSKEEIVRLIDLLQQVLFPGHFGYPYLTEDNLHGHISTLCDSIYDLLSREIFRSVCHTCVREERECAHCEEEAERKVLSLLERVPEIRERLALDVSAAFEGDPAGKSFDEIIFSYPSIHTIMVYRVAHELYALEVPLLPRIMTEHAHSVTGIDIHPGARIGKSFFIDHGTGVVIGETTEIGEYVKIYQGVTLGARSFKRDEQGRIVKGGKRHPTIEDGVTIYANATVLGGDVTIGRGAVIGGNTWVTRSIPAGTVVGMEPPPLKFKNAAGPASPASSGEDEATPSDRSADDDVSDPSKPSPADARR